MELKLKLDRPLVVFDIESTGVNPRQDRIIELAAVKLHPDGREETKTWLLNPTVKIPPETTVIGRNVKLYQGVTLGALSFPKDETTGMLMKGHKRHPNVEDNVVIYAGATILGGDTTIGHDSEIGGNVWLMSSIPPHSRVYNKPPAPEIRGKGD